MKKQHLSGFIYFILAPRSGLVKIGWSKTPSLRLESLQTGSPEPLEMLRTVPSSRHLEATLHEEYAELRSHGEWFHYAGRLAGDLAANRHYSLPAYLPVTPETVPVGRPRLWKHKNGTFYVLYGPRLKRRTSAKTKDAEIAHRFLTSFSLAA